MLFVIITLILLLSYCILLFFYRKSWNEIKDYSPNLMQEHSQLPFISIIVAARNEEKAIGACLKSLFQQNYPQDKYEVIVVNDHSVDGTVPVINQFRKENLRLINLEDYTQGVRINSYKKKSIETALQFAKGELIMTTDADCLVPQGWIETVADFYYTHQPVFIASPVLLSSSEKHSGNRFLDIFQILDFMTLQGITGASVEKKFHSMCNGANLAYTKEVFLEVKGFDGIDNIASGDDMLLMHKIQNKYPDRVLYLKSAKTIVITGAEQNLSGFLHQRIRWASKAGHYTDKKIVIVLILVYLVNAWLLVLGLSSIWSLKAFCLLLFSLGIKMVSELIFLYPVARFFGQRRLLWWMPLFQPFHILYTLIAGWLGKFGQYKWKGRRVR